MLSDGLSSLENSLLNKKKLRMAEQDRQDRITERGQDREDRRAELDSRERLHREVMAANDKERADNVAFRNKQAEATGQHYKNIEAQNAATNARLTAEQAARERRDKQALMQATYQLLATKVEHGSMTPEAAYMAFRPAIDKADPKDIEGTMFSGFSPESFGGPAPAKPGKGGSGSSRLGGDMGTVEETTGPDGTKKTIRRPLTEQDLKGGSSEPQDEDSWENLLAGHQRALRVAISTGNKKAEEEARAAIDRTTVGMMAAKGEKVGVYDRNGVYTPAGGKPGAQAKPAQPGRVPLPGSSESVALPGGGEYKTTSVPWTEHPEARGLLQEIMGLEAELKKLGSAAPQSKPVPVYGAQAGGVSRPTNIPEKLAHDLKVKDLVRKIDEKTKALEALKASNPAK